MKLPPIPEESFDGVKEKTEVKFNRCSHSKIKFINGELRCKCGAAYSGPNLHKLFKLFTGLKT
jgi:hypothetical protein